MSTNYTKQVQALETTIKQASERVAELNGTIATLDKTILTLENEETDIAAQRLTDSSAKLADTHAEHTAVITGKVRQREQLERERASFERVLVTKQRALQNTKREAALANLRAMEQQCSSGLEALKAEMQSVLTEHAMVLRDKIHAWDSKVSEVHKALYTTNELRADLDIREVTTSPPHLHDLIAHNQLTLRNSEDFTHADLFLLCGMWPQVQPPLND